MIKEKKEISENEKKKQLFFLSIILFIIIDIVFIFPITDTMVIPALGRVGNYIWRAIISMAIAAALDVLAYIASAYGLVRLIIIPKIKQSQIINDIIIVGFIFLILGIGVPIFQYKIAELRYEQILEKEEAFEKEKLDYENRIEVIKNDNTIIDNDEKDRRIRTLRRPDVYDRRLDFISMIIPIATTILSFVFGFIPYLMGIEEYDRFKKKADDLQKERNKEQKDYDEATKEEQINYKEATREYERTRTLLLQYANNEVDIDVGITSEKLKAKTNEYLSIISKNFKRNAPGNYKADIERLVELFHQMVIEIKDRFSIYFKNKDLVKKFDYEKEYAQDIAELGKLDNEIMKRG